MDIIPRMHSRSLLTALIVTVVLAGCTLFRSPPAPPAAPGGGGMEAGTSQPAQPAPQAPAAPAPEAPTPPATAPPRQFHLGSATSALVTQAHQQAARGDNGGAADADRRAASLAPH